MKALRTSLLLASGLAPFLGLSACASAGAQRPASIAVRSEPPSAVARLGEQAVTTPGTLLLPADGPVSIRFEKEGCEPTVVVLKRQRRSGRRPTPPDAGEDWRRPGSWTATSGPEGMISIQVPFRTLALWIGGIASRVGPEPWPLALSARLECARPVPAPSEGG